MSRIEEALAKAAGMHTGGIEPGRTHTRPLPGLARMPMSEAARPNSSDMGDDTAEKPYQGIYPKKIDTVMTTSRRCSGFIPMTSF